MKKAKVLLLLFVGVAWPCAMLIANVSSTLRSTNNLFTASYSEAEIKAKVLNGSSVLAGNYDASVQYFVKDYLYYGRKGFQKNTEQRANVFSGH